MFLETFRFEDRNDCKSRFDSTLFRLFKSALYLYVLQEVQPFPNHKMIKPLTFDDLFPLLRHSRSSS